MCDVKTTCQKKVGQLTHGLGPSFILSFRIGVENAFQVTDKVLTVSLHHYAEGFYPGTGSGVASSARTKAVVNIPLKSGLSGTTLLRIFEEMIEPLYMSYNPGAIVVQCGVDGNVFPIRFYLPAYVLDIEPPLELMAKTPFTSMCL